MAATKCGIVISDSCMANKNTTNNVKSCSYSTYISLKSKIMCVIIVLNSRSEAEHAWRKRMYTSLQLTKRKLSELPSRVCNSPIICFHHETDRTVGTCDVIVSQFRSPSAYRFQSYWSTQTSEDMISPHFNSNIICHKVGILWLLWGFSR